MWKRSLFLFALLLKKAVFRPEFTLWAYLFAHSSSVTVCVGDCALQVVVRAKCFNFFAKILKDLFSENRVFLPFLSADHLRVHFLVSANHCGTRVKIPENPISFNVRDSECFSRSCTITRCHHHAHFSGWHLTRQKYEHGEEE